MARRTPPPSRTERFHALLDSGLGRLLVRSTVAALIFLLAGLVMRQARAYTYKLEDFRLSRERVSFTGLPTWADAHVQWALQPRMFRPLSVSIYDPEAESVIRSHVERHPLVRSAGDVRILYPNRVEVMPVLRVPVAQVAVWVDGPGRKQVQRWRLLADDGCLLPRAPYRTYLDRLPYALPAVRGITEPVPQDPGEVWEDRTGRVQEAVAAALLAGRIFRDLKGRVSVTHVDVSRFPAAADRRQDGEVRLVLSCPAARPGGERIQRTVEWGRTERVAVPWEDEYGTKLARLRRQLTSASPATYLDVRWDGSAPRRTQP